MAIINLEFDSVCLNRAVHLNVLIPADNELNKPHKLLQKPLKTLYLLHGMFGSHTDWLHKTEIDDLSREYNLAVVMPSVENSFYLDRPAHREFYNRFIGEELVDFTRKIFPLSDKKEDTSISGLSMGGYGAAIVGLKYHETFGSIMSFSSAFIADKLSQVKPGEESPQMDYDYVVDTFGDPLKILGSNKDPKALAKKLIDEKRDLPRFYIACGAQDYLIEDNRDYKRFLDEINFPHEYTEGDGAHDWNYWRIHIEKAIKWYFS